MVIFYDSSVKMSCDNTIAIVALVIAVLCLIWLAIMQFASGRDDTSSKQTGAGTIKYPVAYFRANMKDAKTKDDVALVLDLVREQTGTRTTAGILATVIDSLRDWNRPPASIKYIPEAVDEYISSLGNNGIDDTLLQEAKQLISDLTTNPQAVDSERLSSTRLSLYRIHTLGRRR